jgi:DNA polymerase-3 subunit alpha
VFQLEGAGMRRMLSDMKPQSFQDVTAAIALFRPGPMVNIPAYVARKQGREAIEYMHERLEPILRETYGVMIYQEQVMMAARELAGFSMSEADILRAAMGKKDKAKMATQREKFISGAVAGGIDPVTAQALFDGIAKFAEYGFNKSHSSAYAVISYQTAYLKSNYPLEYMTALLVHMEGNADRVATAIVDCRARGIEVLSPDVNQSRVDFTIAEGRIRFGLAAIKNVGTKAVELIVAERDENGPYRSRRDLLKRVAGLQDVNFRVLESLVRCGACDSMDERNHLLYSLDRAWDSAVRERRDSDAGQTSFFEMPDLHGSDDSVPREVQPMPGEEKLRSEKELLGLYLSDHPLRRIAAELAHLSDAQAVEITSDLQDTEVRVAGLVRAVRRVITRKGQIMAYAELEDLTGTIDVILFPRVYEQVRHLFEPEAVLVVAGKVDSRTGASRNAPVAADGEEVETESEVASIVADLAWKWDDPDCAPVARRQVVHVDVPGGEPEVVQRLVAVLGDHPGPDDVVLHIHVGHSVVTVNSGQRFQVAAGPALSADLDALFGQPVTRLETVRQRVQSNGNGNGRARH